MRLIVAVGCDGKNCLLDSSEGALTKFDINSIGFEDQPKKAGVYLVELNEIEKPKNKFRYKGKFKLLYHSALMETISYNGGKLPVMEI